MHGFSVYLFVYVLNVYTIHIIPFLTTHTTHVRRERVFQSSRPKTGHYFQRLKTFIQLMRNGILEVCFIFSQFVCMHGYQLMVNYLFCSFVHFIKCVYDILSIYIDRLSKY